MTHLGFLFTCFIFIVVIAHKGDTCIFGGFIFDTFWGATIWTKQATFGVLFL